MRLKKWATKARAAVLVLVVACVILVASLRGDSTSALVSNEAKGLQPSGSASATQSVWALSEFLDIPSKASAAEEEEEQNLPKWGYNTGEEWSDESPKWQECRSGDSQSPVNVKRSYWSGYWGSIWAQRFLQSKRAETGDVVWHLSPPAAKDHRKEGYVLYKGVSFDGHTITIPFKHDRTEGPLVKATAPDGDTYDLEALRVHTPSEHTFDGKAYPMEVQFQHSAVIGGEKTHLGISLFLHLGEESPGFIRKIADAAREALGVHSHTHESDSAWKKARSGVEALEVEEVPFSEIASQILMQTEMPLEIEHHILHADNSLHPEAAYTARSLFADHDAAVPNYKAYYFYRGSRTEPPCDQNWRWVLLKHSMSVNADDLKVIQSLTGRNARPVQKLNGRLIVDSNPA